MIKLQSNNDSISMYVDSLNDGYIAVAALHLPRPLPFGTQTQIYANGVGTDQHQAAQAAKKGLVAVAADVIGSLLAVQLKPDNLFNVVQVDATEQHDTQWQASIYCCPQLSLTEFSFASPERAITLCRQLAVDLIRDIKAQTGLHIDPHTFFVLTDEEEPEPYTDSDIEPELV